MRHARFILSSLALFFGLIVLGVSLLNGSAVQSAGTGFDSTEKQLYLNKEVLPDHVVYPVLMAVDRVKLEIADPTERIYTQAEYANRRLEYSQALLARDKTQTSLALTTLTKAEKYLIHATDEALELNATDTVKKYLLKTIQFHSAEIQNMTHQFGDADRSVVDHMLEENEILISKLSTSPVQSASTD